MRTNYQHNNEDDLNSIQHEDQPSLSQEECTSEEPIGVRRDLIAKHEVEIYADNEDGKSLYNLVILGENYCNKYYNYTKDQKKRVML